MGVSNKFVAKNGLDANNNAIINATSINKVTITAPATGSTLTIADGKNLTVSNTLTFTGIDSSSVAFGTGGTVLYTNNAITTADDVESLIWMGI